MKGCDISHFQGTPDFHAIRDNLQFVIIKATDGVAFVDPQFIRNRDEARKVGLLIGYYHFAEPNDNPPEAEADWFCKNISCLPGEIACLDFEINYPDPVTWCRNFLDKVKSNMGFKPLVYLNQALIKKYDWSPIINAGYGLWLAQYDYNPDGTPVPTPWNTVAIRQYSNKGNVAGITPLDLDVFYGDENQFKLYGNPPPPILEPQPPQTPPSVSEQPTISCEDKLALLEEECQNLNEKLNAITSVITSKNFWFIKYWKIKDIILGKS